MQAILPSVVFTVLVSAVCKQKKATVCKQRYCRLHGTDTEIASAEISTLKETASLSLLCAIAHEALFLNLDIFMNS